ncbi:DNA-binding transcriptional regulator, AcrR family [Halopenitus malekzadehii]|uniref:DNA-binding transcriptional regulator, AcrR family n=1 Tax=Halopenitus malekzadehii TaxID=1267564 RepID=A0A1H6I5P1_9EURY|nr:TetR/AcrR family transcriptional regulator [Halopenitus malekzadehii]SEH42130.1 DNA-binding transcriptional regulator, AcrR family [Halopenitus malekzadehii]
MDDTATEILEATYRALSRHGYADLTIEDIAAEADRSTASIHYYFDDKETLFIEFLEYLSDRYTDRLASIDDDDTDGARQRLLALLAVVLDDDAEATGREFRTAMLEVIAQAPYNEAIRDRMVTFDEVLFERVHAIVSTGVETGEFDDAVDPDLAAEFLVSATTGAFTRQVTIDEPPQQSMETVTGYVDARLLPDESENL